MRTMSKRKKVSAVSKAAELIGSLGGKARAKNLSDEEKRTIARQGAAARWKGKKRVKRVSPERGASRGGLLGTRGKTRAG